MTASHDLTSPLDSFGTHIEARLAIAPESAEQVRPTEALATMAFQLRGVRAQTVDLQGPLYLPRQCAVVVSFPGMEGSEGPWDGVVRKTFMADGSPRYVLSVQLETAAPVVLGDLRSRLDGRS